MKISLGLTTKIPTIKVRKNIDIANKIGLHRIFVEENSLHREIFTYLSILALQIKQNKSMTGVINPFNRNIAVIASNSIALQQITNNNFSLGIRISELTQEEQFTDQKFLNAIEIVKETTFILRKIFNGERININGIKHNLKGYKLDTQDALPPKIYFSANREKILSLAGRISDGVIFNGPKNFLLRSLKIVNEASTKAGRKKGDVEKLILNFVINLNSKKDIEFAKLTVANIASNLPIEKVKNQKLANDILKIKKSFKKCDYKRAKNQVTYEMLNNFCFFGRIDEIIEEVKKFEKAGFDEFVISSPFGMNHIKTIKKIKKIVSE